MLDLNAPMNATPKMDNFAKKCIFLGEVAKIGGGCPIKIPKASRRHGWDH